MLKQRGPERASLPALSFFRRNESDRWQPPDVARGPCRPTIHSTGRASARRRASQTPPTPGSTGTTCHFSLRGESDSNRSHTPRSVGATPTPATRFRFLLFVLVFLFVAARDEEKEEDEEEEHFSNHQPQPKESHEIPEPSPTSPAPSPELQTESNSENPTGRRAQGSVPSAASRSSKDRK